MGMGSVPAAVIIIICIRTYSPAVCMGAVSATVIIICGIAAAMAAAMMP